MISDDVQVVYAGHQEYSWALNFTEITGKNIEGRVCQVAVLPTTREDAPTEEEWATPDSITNPTTASVRVAQLVGADELPGRYRIWIRLEDTPEDVVRPSSFVIEVKP